MSETIKNLGRKLVRRGEIGTIIPLALLMLITLAVNSSFFAVANIMDVLRTASSSLMVAVPITFLLSSGGMDLSIGAATSLGGVVCGQALLAGLPIPAALLLAVLAGMVVGTCNGIVVVKHQMPPFIATLGMQYVINGLLTIWTGGISLTNFKQNSFKLIGQGKLFGTVPNMVLYALVIAVLGHIVLNKSKYGRAVVAVGGNAETAHLAGISVVPVKISVHMMASMMAALTGCVICSRFFTAQPNAGAGTELTIMASVIIGGTSHRGGFGTIPGTVLGCILLASIQNCLIVMGVSTYWLNFIFGLILLASLYIDKYRRQAAGGM